MSLDGRELSVKLATPGAHIAQNSLAVVAALAAAGLDVASAVTPLASLAPPPAAARAHASR